MRRSSFRQALAWGRRAYRLTAIGYSAIQVYQNPWLVQAVLTALWSFSKLSLRFFA